jgi:hypothetical protein
MAQTMRIGDPDPPSEHGPAFGQLPGCDRALCREVGRSSSGAVVRYCSAMRATIPRSRLTSSTSSSMTRSISV